MSALAVALALFAVAGAQSPPKPVEAAKAPASSAGAQGPEAHTPAGHEPRGRRRRSRRQAGRGRLRDGGAGAGGLPLVRRPRAGEGPLDGHRPRGEGEARVAPAGAVERHGPRSRLRHAADAPSGLRPARGAAREGRCHHRCRARRRRQPADRRRPGRRRVAACRRPSGWSAEATRNEAVTDAEGRFRLEGIGRAPVRLSARARGFGRAERSGVRAGSERRAVPLPRRHPRRGRAGRRRAAGEGRRRARRGRHVLERAAHGAHRRARRVRDGGHPARASTRWWPARAAGPPGSPRWSWSPRTRPRSP